MRGTYMPIRKIRQPRYLGAAVIALTSALAVALWPGAAAAQVTPDHYSSRSTFLDAIFAPCADEFIELTTTISFTSTGFMQPSGQAKYTGHLSIIGEGEGSLGNHYRYSLIQNVSEMRAPDITPEVFAYTFHERLSGQGDAPEIWLRWREHITVNANGETAVYFSDLSAECH
jgi:hypothetical protein